MTVSEDVYNGFRCAVCEELLGSRTYFIHPSRGESVHHECWED